MSDWLTACALGAGFVVLGYAGRGGRPWPSRALPAACRFVAVTLAAALWLDAPVGAARALTRTVALDVSASWRRGADTARWGRARAAADSLGGATLLVGAGVSAGEAPPAPSAPRSRIAGLVDRALAEGRAVALVTDGELEDAEALGRLPAGSMVVVPPGAPRPDAAIAALDLPTTAVVGDTVTVVVRLLAGAAGAGATTLAVGLEGTGVAARAPVAAFAPFEERASSVTLVVPAAGGGVVRATLGGGDTEARNDTLRAALDVLERPQAVVVSTAPDGDVRWLDAGVRQALGAGVRTWWRVAEGQWREVPSMAAVDERDVRRGVAEAGVVVLHGDTAFFGPPGQAVRGARWLVPAGEAGGEWYVAPPVRGASPLGDVLGGASLDSLPPLTVRAAPSLAWTALVARAGRQGDGVPVLTGSDGPPRTVVWTGAGLARWGLRGGEAGAAVTALAGSVAAWLGDAAPDRRAALPLTATVREGEALAWRRTSGDSVVVVRWTRRGGGAGMDTLRFGSETSASGQDWPAGVYDVAVRGGALTLVVNPSREWLPARPTVRPGPVGGAAAAAIPPRLRDWPGWYALVVALLCVEWVLRRRAGLR